jgi:hypothetical protein
MRSINNFKAGTTHRTTETSLLATSFARLGTTNAETQHSPHVLTAGGAAQRKMKKQNDIIFFKTRYLLRQAEVGHKKQHIHSPTKTETSSPQRSFAQVVQKQFEFKTKNRVFNRKTLFVYIFTGTAGCRLYCWSTMSVREGKYMSGAEEPYSASFATRACPPNRVSSVLHSTFQSPSGNAWSVYELLDLANKTRSLKNKNNKLFLLYQLKSHKSPPLWAATSCLSSAVRVCVMGAERKWCSSSSNSSAWFHASKSPYRNRGSRARLH